MAATGFSFLVFGAGGLLFGFVIFPILRLLVTEREERASRAREIIRIMFRLFINFMSASGVLRYEIKGLERLQRRGMMILANHPTLMDTVFLMAFVKNADCVVKSSLWINPFTKGAVRTADYIRNDSGTDLVGEGIDTLRRGGNLIIFPEGTRTQGQINLKRGAANIAVRCLSNVTPVIIRCSPPTLSKGEKWWHVPPAIAHFSIEVKEDIVVQDFVLAAGSNTLAARHLTVYLQEYFRKESEPNGAT